MFEDIIASKETSTARHNICKQCEYYQIIGFDMDRCTVCGCVMVAKTKLAKFSCPKGKWQAEAVD